MSSSIHACSKFQLKSCNCQHYTNMLERIKPLGVLQLFDIPTGIVYAEMISGCTSFVAYSYVWCIHVTFLLSRCILCKLHRHTNNWLAPTIRHPSFISTSPSRVEVSEWCSRSFSWRNSAPKLLGKLLMEFSFNADWWLEQTYSIRYIFWLNKVKFFPFFHW